MWMREALEEIDKQFGVGYASNNPELVAGFVQAAAIDQAWMYIRSLVETLGFMARFAGLKLRVSQ